MIFVDSNVFVIALRYPRDKNAAVNQRFLENVATTGDAVTSIVNVLEVSGILSFNLNRRQLHGLYAHFARRFRVRLVPAVEDELWLATKQHEVLEYLSRRMSFGDALVALAADRWATEASAFVSWDARHFAGKIIAPAMTPKNYLETI